jgi:hypothetical protein
MVIGHEETFDAKKIRVNGHYKGHYVLFVNAKEILCPSLKKYQ